MGELIQQTIDPAVIENVLWAGAPPELLAQWLDTTRVYHHGRLSVMMGRSHYSLESAFNDFFGIQNWIHVSVSVRGQLQARLKDKAKIGRARRGGERSPVPLPDWYDLTHIAYEHPELGFNRFAPVYQYLPPPSADYLNIADALHLRQPA